ncbi:MAG: protein kinase [Victivallales bacterium]|nr:protein kinase [Victivallales bacterium]
MDEQEQKQPGGSVGGKTIVMTDQDLERTNEKTPIYIPPLEKNAHDKTRNPLVALLGETIEAVTGRIDDKTSDFYSTLMFADGDETPPPELTADDANISSAGEANYIIQDQIAVGGQGRINKAEDRQFQRTVAVKTLLENLRQDPRIRASFINEARITARLEHPSVVPVYGIYTDADSGLHLAMKLVAGRTLREYLESIRQRYSFLKWRKVATSERRMLPQRLEFFLRLCDAVNYVHHRNIIHKDLKPENIMIGRFNETYVMDWGIAEELGPNGAAITGPINGTPRYISPEILLRQPYDQRSDIYLLGLLLYEIVFLRRAFPQEDQDRALEACREGKLAPFVHFYGCIIDENLKAIIKKATEFAPEKRYQSVKEMTSDIRAFLADEPVSVAPHPWLSAISSAIRHHHRIVILSIVVLLAALVLKLTWEAINEWQRQMAEARSNAILEQYSNNQKLSEANLDRKVTLLEGTLWSLAHEASVRLENPLPPNPSLQFYDYRDGQSPETAPPGFGFAPSQQKDCSFTCFMYKAPEDLPATTLASLLTTLDPIRDNFHQIMCWDFDRSHKKSRKDGTRDLIFEETPVHRIFVGLENGLHIAYPYQSDYLDTYDPRTRRWYTQAAEKTEMQPVWSVPYVERGTRRDIVIGCSCPIFSRDNKLLGVAGASIKPDTFLRFIGTAAPDPSMVRSRYLVHSDGKVYADASGHRNPTLKRSGALSFAIYPGMNRFKQMWKRRNGVMFEENTKDMLYIFQYISAFDCLYIEEIDFTNILDK